MRINSLIVLLTLLLSGSIVSYGQHSNYDRKSEGNSVSVRQVEFIVRNGDYIKNIASRAKIPVRDIIKINKLRSKNYLAYPGRRLILPVQVQSKVWDPTKEDMTGNSPSREDRGGTEDFELVIDSSNYGLIDDFINLAEARSDSIEYENIGTHLKKIEKRVNYLRYKIDSIKQVDFKFDYEDQDKNSILSKMKMSRDKYYAEGPLGKQIDSLAAAQLWLGQRRIVLRNQITEYEYLVDNASYSEHNFKHEEKDKPSDWGSHLAYESIYMKSKAKAAAANTAPDTAKKAAVAPPDTVKKMVAVIPDTAKKITVAPSVTKAEPVAVEPPVVKKEPAAAVVDVKPENSAPKVAKVATAVDTTHQAIVAPKVTPPVKTVAPEPSVAVVKKENPAPSVKIVEKEDVNMSDTAAEIESVSTHYKSDFSLLPKLKFLPEITHTVSSLRSLLQLSADATSAIKPIATAKSPVPAPAVKEAPKAQPLTTTKTEKAAPVIKESPKAQVVTTEKTAPVIKETPKPKEAPAVSKPDTIVKSIKAPQEAPAPVQKTNMVSPDTVTHISIAAKQTVSKDTFVPVQHEKVTIESAPAQVTSISATDKPALSLDSKIDTAIERQPKVVNQDPLATYKSDSDFVAKNVQIKDIPIAEYKNKPKYLIPTDSVNKIKGDFYLIRARQVLEKGDFKTGDKYLRKSLDLDPNNAQAWMLHADLFLTMGLADQALKEYTISSEIDSTNPKIFYNIALLFTKANNHQKAYKYFTKAIEVNNKYLLAYMGRASLQMDERDYEGAIGDYDRVLQANKYYSPAFKARGLAKMEVRKFTEAIQDFNQYLEIEDPDGYVIFQRGLSKIYSNNLLQGCLDLSSAQELGFKEAEKAIKKFCE